MNIGKVRLPSFIIVLPVLNLIALGLADWHRTKATKTRDVVAVAGVSDLALNEAEQKRCLVQAAAGDAAAAYRLAQYHGFNQNNQAEGERWLTRAAALGHAEAQKGLEVIADQRRMHEAHLEAVKAWGTGNVEQ